MLFKGQSDYSFEARSRSFAARAEAGETILATEFVEGETLEARVKRWKAPPNPYQSGALRKYAELVGPARKGAVTRPSRD